MNKKQLLSYGSAIGVLTALTLAFQNCGGAKQFSAAVYPSIDNPVVPMCRDVDASEVTPKLKWDWIKQLPSSPDKRYPSFDQVMAAPMVADLDGDKKPEAVFITFSKTSTDWFSDSVGPDPAHPWPNHFRNGVLRIVDGATGKTKLSVGSAALAPHGSHSPLLVDIDGDGKVEIVYIHYLSTPTRAIIALNYDGSLRWKYQVSSALNFVTGFTASDVNNDGIAEFQVGPMLITENSAKQPYQLLTMAGATYTNSSTVSVALDPSQPSKISLINAAGIYNANGSRAFAFQTPQYYLSVADIFPEKRGLEIIGTGDGTVTIYNGLSGELLSSKDLSQYNSLKCPSKNVVGGGPSSVGDFDGDPSTLEIAVATGRYLTIFDRTTTPIYQSLSQDCSSLATGLTSFDLNGDKKPEIFYADEEYLRIYEVENGVLEIRHKIVNPSGTLTEYPVIVDLDGNGSAELLVVSNNYAAGSFYLDADEVMDKTKGLATTGVRAFESAEADSWMPARPIWNQFSFHPDQFTDRSRLIPYAVIDSTIFRRNNQGYNTNMDCR